MISTEKVPGYHSKPEDIIVGPLQTCELVHKSFLSDFSLGSLARSSSVVCNNKKGIRQ
jgi:hypothetical protein